MHRSVSRVTGYSIRNPYLRRPSIPLRAEAYYSQPLEQDCKSVEGYQAPSRSGGEYNQTRRGRRYRADLFNRIGRPLLLQRE